jgi:hypothetical protein
MLQFSFDVYAFDGEQWTLRSTFSTTQREEAFACAQRIYAEARSHGVRIIQETFDGDRGGSARRPLLSRIKARATAQADAPQGLVAAAAQA